MKLSEAMIWWNSAEEQELAGDLPQVKVLPRLGPGNERFSYLSNSVGACFGGWGSARPEDLATHVLAIYAQMVGRDGVSAVDAHRELLLIDEYRDWCENSAGPFADAYWAWGATPEDTQTL